MLDNSTAGGIKIEGFGKTKSRDDQNKKVVKGCICLFFSSSFESD